MAEHTQFPVFFFFLHLLPLKLHCFEFEFTVLLIWLKKTKVCWDTSQLKGKLHLIFTVHDWAKRIKQHLPELVSLAKSKNCYVLLLV